MFGLTDGPGGGQKMIKMVLGMIGGTEMIQSAIKSNAQSAIDFAAQFVNSKVVLNQDESKIAVLLFEHDAESRPGQKTLLAMAVTLNDAGEIVRKIAYYDLYDELMRADIKGMIDKKLSDAGE